MDASPSVYRAAESLFSMTGLFTTAPVLLCGVLALVLLYRRGYRAETGAIAAVATLVVLYNASYQIEFDAYSGGERYLTWIMPLLAVPLAISYRRLPSTTGGLALVSGLLAIALASSHVRYGLDPNWFREISQRRFPQTVLGIVGITGWYAVLPFFAAVAFAAVAAVAATGPVRVSAGETALAGLAVLGWAVAAAAAPNLYAPGAKPLSDYLVVLLVGAVLVGAVAARRLRDGRLQVGAANLHRARG